MNEEPQPKKKRRAAPKRVSLNPRREPAMTDAAIQDPRFEAARNAAAMQNMLRQGQHQKMAERKENFVPVNPQQFQSDSNLVANNPFDDRPQQMLTNTQPRFIQVNPMPRRGINPDQIGNMDYMRMRNMQQANQELMARNRMAYPPNRFKTPPMGPVNKMNSAILGQEGYLMNDARMQGNPNHSQMMNPQMVGGSMSRGDVMNGPPVNSFGVKGLAMNGSMMIDRITGSNQDHRVSPGNRMIGNGVSPVNPTMNAPILTPLLSPDHMNRTMNMPPIVHPQQCSNQMNDTRDPMQQPPNMPKTCPPHGFKGSNALIGSNNQLNNTDISRPFSAPGMNTMTENPRHPMEPSCSQNDQQDDFEAVDRIISRTIQNFESGDPTGRGMNRNMSTFQQDPQGMMNPTFMPGGSDEKIYPPNQPMFFNPHNPQAPPIVPCRICRREIQPTDQAIFCESGCDFWYHRHCVGMTEIGYEMMMKEPFAEWACDKCLAEKNIPPVKYKP